MKMPNPLALKSAADSAAVVYCLMRDPEVDMSWKLSTGLGLAAAAALATQAPALTAALGEKGAVAVAAALGGEADALLITTLGFRVALHYADPHKVAFHRAQVANGTSIAHRDAAVAMQGAISLGGTLGGRGRGMLGRGNGGGLAA